MFIIIIIIRLLIIMIIIKMWNINYRTTKHIIFIIEYNRCHMNEWCSNNFFCPVHNILTQNQWMINGYQDPDTGRKKIMLEA